MLEQWTLFEWLDATLKEAHRVEARANALRDEMVAALDSTRHDLLASLARLQEKYLFTEDWQSETFTRKTAYLRAQREAVDALLAEVRAEIDGKVKEAAEDVIMSAGITATTMMEPIPALAPMIQAGAAGITSGLLKSWIETQAVDGLLVNEWLDKMTRDTADRLVMAGREALIMGYGTRKTASLLRTKGIEGSVPQLEAMARTFLASASNYARVTSIERLTENKGILKGWKYVATLDGRTCPVCGHDDGKVFQRDKLPSLPRHVRRGQKLAGLRY